MDSFSVIPLWRTQGLAGLDPEPRSHQPLCSRRQLLHQHRYLLLEGREVLGHHAHHHEDPGPTRKLERKRGRPAGQTVPGRHRGDRPCRSGRDDDGERDRGARRGQRDEGDGPTQSQQPTLVG